MFPFKRIEILPASLFAAVLFSVFGAGGASAQDITPGSSVMESKAKKPPAKAKSAPKSNAAPNAKPPAKANKTGSPPRAKNSPPPASGKTAKPQPKEPADETIGELNLEIVSAAAPVYPSAAKQAGAKGSVRVVVAVDENGDVVSAEASDGHELLRATAEAAARASKFVPRKVKGKGVQTRGYLTYCFGGKCD